MRHSVLQEKLAEQAFRQLDIFRRRFYEPSFLHLLIRKALELVTMTSAPRDQQRASAKMCSWLHVPPFTKITYNTDLPPVDKKLISQSKKELENFIRAKVEDYNPGESIPESSED